MMIYILVGIGVILALKLVTESYKRKKALSKRSYKLWDGFYVTKAELDETDQLLSWQFCSNEYCRREIIALFIDVKRNLAKSKRRKAAPSFNKTLLRYCREVTLKIIDFQDPLQDATLSEKPEAAIIELVKERAAVVVRPLTAESDRSLYYSGDAWEVRYSHLIKGFEPGNVAPFYEAICQLGMLSNKRVTIQREIYYEAHLFLLFKDKEYCLKLYLQYLHVKTHTYSFVHKKIAKASRQWLFRDTREEQQFDQLCSKLLKDKRINAALKQFDKLGIAQRKKIQLDIISIKEAAGKQARVAGILSDILDDEPAATPKDAPVIDNKEALLQLFIDKDYRLTKEEVDIFAQSKGVFTGQLIQRINEAYFDELDDVLIEEEDGGYRLNKMYFNKVVKVVK
ncbi:MAG: hypothetical protein LBK45_02250 [Tannerellaceae bacterium]|jgi:hypothetical protein|nr:hypothetical protein [Tannerellaceae bacterium]